MQQNLISAGDRGAEGQPAAHEQPEAGEPGVRNDGRGGECDEGPQEEEAGLLLNHVKVEHGRRGAACDQPYGTDLHVCSSRRQLLKNESSS